MQIYYRAISGGHLDRSSFGCWRDPEQSQAACSADCLGWSIQIALSWMKLQKSIGSIWWHWWSCGVCDLHVLVRVWHGSWCVMLRNINHCIDTQPLNGVAPAILHTLPIPLYPSQPATKTSFSHHSQGYVRLEGRSQPSRSSGMSCSPPPPR